MKKKDEDNFADRLTWKPDDVEVIKAGDDEEPDDTDEDEDDEEE